MPVWIDQFGIKKYKTILLTILFMANSFGMIIGAWIGTVVFKNEWKKSFDVGYKSNSFKPFLKSEIDITLL